MEAHRRPISASWSKMMPSSSSVHALLSTIGRRWCTHRSRHCFPVRSGTSSAMRLQGMGSGWAAATRMYASRSNASSAAVHGCLKCRSESWPTACTLRSAGPARRTRLRGPAAEALPSPAALALLLELGRSASRTETAAKAAMAAAAVERGATVAGSSTRLGPRGTGAVGGKATAAGAEVAAAEATGAGAT